MANEEYLKLWLIFVNIKAKKGLIFSDLIDSEGIQKDNYVGAWANVIVKANTINEALEICPLGLSELGFEIEFIDKVENFMSGVENNELSFEVINEGKWLLQSSFLFMVSDKLFPY